MFKVHLFAITCAVMRLSFHAGLFLVDTKAVLPYVVIAAFAHYRKQNNARKTRLSESINAIKMLRRCVMVDRLLIFVTS